ncbi:MAG TPA: hypothetical protein PKC21_00890 [Oligoflexia bacterium]|nr:hypothetical protein [Oligoflexia bacterium]HMR23885.1 hypothetical protein [Oligoflexia bacterium]
MYKIYLNSLIYLCLLSLVFCTPDKIQVDLNAPITPGQLNLPENPVSKEDKTTDDSKTEDMIRLNIALSTTCNYKEQESTPPTDDDRQQNLQDNGNSSVSELAEARRRQTGRRGGLEPGEKASVISIDYGPMYLNRNKEGIYSLSPAFKNDNNSFIGQSFSVPQDQLTQDGESFRYTSENDIDTEFYISVSSPEFGLQNCSINEFCEDSDETYRSDLYLLRFNSELFSALKAQPVSAALYKDKKYDIYALSPKFKSFCNNQTASLSTFNQEENSNTDLVIQNIDLALKQENAFTFTPEEENTADFKTYFSKGKDNQAILYFISEKVWYIALAQK